MTMLMTGSNTDYDGSGVPLTVDGPVVVTLSGTLGAIKKGPTLTMYSRSDTAEFVALHTEKGFGRFRANLAPDDECYFIVTNVRDDDSIDLSIVSAQ